MPMAAISLHPSFCLTHTSLQLLKSRSCNSPRILIVLSCQNKEPIEDKEKKRPFSLCARVFTDLHKLGRGLKQNMSPQQKGDWKDLMLMSLSFAVYVYMSQQIVCAYCAWISMPRQSW